MGQRTFETRSLYLILAEKLFTLPAANEMLPLSALFAGKYRVGWLQQFGSGVSRYAGAFLVTNPPGSPKLKLDACIGLLATIDSSRLRRLLALRPTCQEKSAALIVLASPIVVYAPERHCRPSLRHAHRCETSDRA